MSIAASIAQLKINVNVDGLVALEGDMSRVAQITTRESDKMARALGAQAQAVAKLGETNRQTAQAMRMLPAQMTDVVTQLAGGQSPWLVLIQQGGQARDMFGGFGPMFKDLAGYVTPVNVGLAGTAGALGLVAYSMIEVDRRNKEFSNSLKLTGNAAGITRDRFDEVAGQISRSAKTTIASAREIETAVMRSGTFSSTNFVGVSQAVAQLERASGESAESIVKDFANMRNGVAQWAAEHNRQYNFITAAQYEHIRALEDQGNKEEAIRVTVDALNGALSKHEVEIGLLERAYKRWAGIIDNVKEKLAGMSGTATASGQMQALQQKISDAQDRMSRLGGDESMPLVRRLKSDIENWKSQIAVLMEQYSAQEQLAASSKKTAEVNQAGIEGSKVIARVREETDYRIKLNRELDLYKKSIADMQKAGMAVPGAAEQIKALEAIKARYTPKTARSAEDKDPLGKEINRALLEDDKRLQGFAERLAATNDPLAKFKEQYSQAVQLLEAGKWTPEMFASFDAAKTEEMNKAIAKLNPELRELQEIISQTDFGKFEAFLRKKKILDDALDRGDINRRVYDSAIKEIDPESKKGGDDKKAGEWDQLISRMRSAQSEATVMASVMSSAFDKTSDAIANFVLTGKLNFKDFASSLISDFVRIMTKKMLLDAVLSSGNGGGGESGGSAGQYAGWFGAAMQMFGTAHQGGIAGQSYTGSTVISPAAFATAPRYHTGGIAANEVPIVAKVGEGIFTEDQMRNMAPVSLLRSELKSRKQEGDMHIHMTLPPGTAPEIRRAGGAAARDVGRAVAAARRYS